MRRQLPIWCVAAAATCLAGCSDPYADETRPPTERAVAETRQPVPIAERGRTAGDALPPRRLPARVRPAGTPAASPRAVARSFAERSLNWTWRDRDAPYRALLGLAVGPLHGELVRARAAVRRDDTIARDRLGARGRFVAVDVQGGGRSRRLVVVVREEALIDGRGALEGPRHRVYLAEAQRTEAGWGMVRWAPAP